MKIVAVRRRETAKDALTILRFGVGAEETFDRLASELPGIRLLWLDAQPPLQPSSLKSCLAARRSAVPNPSVNRS